MKNACVISPNKGKTLFRELKNKYGWDKAANIFNRVITEEFINDFRDSLTLDSEGVPTIESLTKLPIIRHFLGEEAVLRELNESQKVVDDTAENTKNLVYEADRLNQEDKEHIAIVDYAEDGGITIRVLPKTEQNEKIAQTQKAIQDLNEKMLEILRPAGVTVEDLSDIEVATGKVGEANFKHFKGIADEFNFLLRIANNMQGSQHFSEEFAHTLVNIYRNSPLMQRAINYLSNEKNARKVLGEKYQQYYDEYSGDADYIAEEAAGQMLQQQFIQAQIDQNNAPQNNSLFSRVKNFILNKFKGINPGHYKDSIDSIERGMYKLAQDLISDKVKITKQDVKASVRDKKFYALGAKAKEQLEVLKDSVTILERMSKFLKNTEGNTEKYSQKKNAQDLGASIAKISQSEETMEGIMKLIMESSKELEDSYSDLKNLEDLEIADKFKKLQNALTISQGSARVINRLYSVLSDEYLQDPDIARQHFMVQDTEDKLKDFRTTERVTQTETSNLTQQEIAQLIQKDDKSMKLSDDGLYYVDKEGNKYMRVTELIGYYEGAHPFDPNSPYKTPSTNIGTGIDELTRDYVSGRFKWNDTVKQWEVEGKRLDEVYPNANNAQLNSFVSQLHKSIKDLRDQGITFIPRDVIAQGTVDMRDSRGNIHTIRVAGTLDLLGYDNDGNWYIYDMKTHRSKEINQGTKDKYANQISLYKKFLEEKYGIKIKSLNIIPIKVNYPAPVGAERGKATYTVSGIKPVGYNGTESNQLIVNGEEFRNANPFLEKIFQVDQKDPNVDYTKLAQDYYMGKKAAQAVLDALSYTNSRYTMLQNLFYEKALEYFTSFLSQYMGDTVKIQDETGALKEVPLKEVIQRSGKDIGMMSKMFTTLSDSPDALLRAFNKVFQDTRNEARMNTIEISQRIAALGLKYKDKGLTNFDFMYSDDNQTYITKLIIDKKDYSYDKAAFDKAFQDYKKQLNALYGENPQIGSEEYNKRKKAQTEWMSENTEWVTYEGHRIAIPSHTKYPSRYSSLTQTQKEFFDEWMELKDELDKKLPYNATTLNTTIKIRRSNFQRAADLLTKGDYKGIINSAKATLLRDYNDAINYNGIVDMNDREVLTLPIYFIHAKDASDITHDPISSLIAYADMACNYEAMNKVLDPLEIGKEWVMNKREIASTRGGRTVIGTNKVGFGRVTSEAKIDPKSSNFGKALEAFFKSKIFEQFVDDNGSVKIPLTHYQQDLNKLADMALRAASTIQMGFNTFAHITNVGTGIAMQNIEAAAGQFFNARELAKADAYFFSELPAYLGDIGQTKVDSMLGLLDELFDVRQDFRRDIKNRKYLDAGFVKEMFGPNIAFLGQEIGDFWLYNRTFLAMSERYELVQTIDGVTKNINLLQAFEKVPVVEGHPEYGNKLKIKDGVTKKDGTAFTRKDISDFSNKVKEVNKHLFGIYNQQDSLEVRQHVWGKFLMQYRDWIPTQYMYRFGALRYNEILDTSFEGYYRTSLKFSWELAKELAHGQMTIREKWDSLEDWQKANIRRAIAEIAQYQAVRYLTFLLGTKSKIKRRGWVEVALKDLQIIMYRESMELGALTATHRMPMELIKMLKSPVAATSVFEDLWNLTNLTDPQCWQKIMQNGPYKGHSEAYKIFMNSPLVPYVRNLMRPFNPDSMLQYYESIGTFQVA